jgi:UDP-glucose:(galactosyl)LPS alpha-1,2-glucosyltransferase
MQTKNAEPISLLVTLNAGYLGPLGVMLFSVLEQNPTERFRVFVLHSSLTEADLADTRALLGPENELLPIRVEPGSLLGAPTSDRYPTEIYYRIFAAKYLPKTLDRVLYLDPDLVVKGSLGPLFRMDLGNSLFAAASHVRRMMTYVNSLRLDTGRPEPYINSGVMLMNLAGLRERQDEAAVYAYIEKHRARLFLPDQDVISGLYGASILPLDPYVYNLTEKLFALRPESDAWLDLGWIEKNTVIVHYCGRNKPWKENYVGALDGYWLAAKAGLDARRTR